MKMQQVGLRVTNLERSLRFYMQALGLRVRTRGDTRSWGGELWVQLEDPKSHRHIELNWYPPGSRFGPRYTVGAGVDHIDFTIGAAPVAALERTYRRLRRAGGRPTRFEPATTGGWMASVEDPDGIWITSGRRPTAAERRAIEKRAAVRKPTPPPIGAGNGRSPI
jgi:catechol 2,3-dioxygenase-like lactoylglutathione lyase family enzyme